MKKTTGTTKKTVAEMTGDEQYAALDAEMTDADRAYWEEAGRQEIAAAAAWG
jgi:hypothetical protein